MNEFLPFCILKVEKGLGGQVMQISIGVPSLVYANFYIHTFSVPNYTVNFWERAALCGNLYFIGILGQKPS